MNIVIFFLRAVTLKKVKNRQFYTCLACFIVYHSIYIYIFSMGHNHSANCRHNNNNNNSNAVQRKLKSLAKKSYHANNNTKCNKLSNNNNKHNHNNNNNNNHKQHQQSNKNKNNHNSNHHKKSKLRGFKLRLSQSQKSSQSSQFSSSRSIPSIESQHNSNSLVISPNNNSINCPLPIINDELLLDDAKCDQLFTEENTKNVHTIKDMLKSLKSEKSPRSHSNSKSKSNNDDKITAADYEKFFIAFHQKQQQKKFRNYIITLNVTIYKYE